MALKLGINLRTIPITANYTVTAFDDIINADATSGAITVTLPDATTIPGKQIKVNKVDSSGNAVTITGPQLINGVSSVQLGSQNEGLEIASVSGVYALVGAGFKSVQTQVKGGRNYLINGNFDFWQRQITFAISGSTLDKFYTADRWKVWAGGGEADTVTQVAGSIQTAAFGYKYARNSGNSNTGQRWITQIVESKTARLLAGRTVTLSFRCKAGANFSAGTLSSTVSTATGTDESYSGAWTGGVDQVQNNVLTTSFQLFTQTVFLPATTNEIAVSFKFNPTGTAGTDDSFTLEQVMLNEGSVAVPFSIAGGDIAGEFQKCLRYYFKSYNQGVYPGAADFNSTWMMIAEDPNNAAWMHGKFPVPMRAVPTAQIYSASTGTAGALYYVQGGGNPVPTQFANFKSENGLGFTNNGGGVFTANGHYYANVTADADF